MPQVHGNCFVSFSVRLPGTRVLALSAVWRGLVGRQPVKSRRILHHGLLAVGVAQTWITHQLLAVTRNLCAGMGPSESDTKARCVAEKRYRDCCWWATPLDGHHSRYPGCRVTGDRHSSHCLDKILLLHRPWHVQASVSSTNYLGVAATVGCCQLGLYMTPF